MNAHAPVHARPSRARQRGPALLMCVVLVAALAATCLAAPAPARSAAAAAAREQQPLPAELESLLAYRSQAGLPPHSVLAARAREPALPAVAPPPLASTFTAAGELFFCCFSGRRRRACERRGGGRASFAPAATVPLAGRTPPLTAGALEHGRPRA